MEERLLTKMARHRLRELQAAGYEIPEKAARL
jgi:hypothetical protein